MFAQHEENSVQRVWAVRSLLWKANGPFVRPRSFSTRRRYGAQFRPQPIALKLRRLIRYPLFAPARRLLLSLSL